VAALIPYLVVSGAPKAISFYKKAFGAKEVHRMAAPNGKIVHAELEIGTETLMLSDEFDETTGRSPKSLQGTTGSIYLYVKDADAVFKKAVAAGARVLMPMADMFWGDRYGKIEDPFGHQWAIATKVERLSSAEMKRRSDAFFASFKK
jgi:PhnB protein